VLLTRQAQPDSTNDGKDISPWAGEPVYDFLDRSIPDAVPMVSEVFATRYFNFVPPGAASPAFVPLFVEGNPVPNVLCDDCATPVPITFGSGSPPDAGTASPDALP
jgi:hypothetical protein